MNNPEEVEPYYLNEARCILSIVIQATSDIETGIQDILAEYIGGIIQDEVKMGVRFALRKERLLREYPELSSYFRKGDSDE